VAVPAPPGQPDEAAARGRPLPPVADAADRPVEDVERLVLVVVDVERGGEARGVGELDDAEHAAAPGPVPLDEGEGPQEPDRRGVVLADDVERARGLCHLVSSPRALAKPVRRAALARGRPREGPPQHGRGCRGDEALDHPPPADGLLALATGGRRLVVACVALVDHRDQPPSRTRGTLPHDETESHYRWSLDRVNLLDGGRMGRYESYGRRRQKQRTRDALKTAAAELLAEGHVPTVAEVAERAEVSRATAYRYFPNQDALVAEVLLDQAVGDGLRSVYAAAREGASAEERLAAVVRADHDLVTQNEGAFRTAIRA